MHKHNNIFKMINKKMVYEKEEIVGKGNFDIYEYVDSIYLDKAQILL